MNYIVAQSEFDEEAFEAFQTQLNESIQSGEFQTTTTTTDANPLLALPVLLIGLVALIVLVASMWKIFTKAGRPGWAALVPIYNSWVLFEVAGKPGWWALLGLLGAIPFVGAVVVFILGVIAALGLAKNFGKSEGFAALLVLLPIVGYPILGFGDAKYQPVTVAGSGGSPQPQPTPAATADQTQPQNQQPPQDAVSPEQTDNNQQPPQ